MQYKCEFCNDTGSLNKFGPYYDCTSCDAAEQRVALEKFLDELREKGEGFDDIAFAIHQRALAMAPKQEAPTKSLLEMTDDLIFQWAEGYVFTLKGMPNKMTFTRPRFVAAVRTIIAHLPASVAAPAVANGALPELPDPLEIDWPTLNSNALGCGVEDRGLHDRYECAEYGWQDGMDMAASRVPDVIYDADQMRAYGQACAAAGLDTMLVKALEEVIKECCAWYFELSGQDGERLPVIKQARSALSGAKGN